MGRWYWGNYYEFGFDVKLQRVSGAPLLTFHRPFVVQGAVPRHSAIRILGENLPTK